MKKIAILLTLVAVLFAACDPQLPEEEPTEQEKMMVPAEMSWRLDSIMNVYNYQTPYESSRIIRPEDGLDVWTYTFYPSTYQFPEEMVFVNEMTGKEVNMRQQYGKDYCKYITTYKDNVISAGYLCYYKDFFTFNGLQLGGWMEFMIREADTNWDVEVWTSTFNTEETLEGEVLSRRTEYYSRVR